jgi:hypothetical protein
MQAQLHKGHKPMKIFAVATRVALAMGLTCGLPSTARPAIQDDSGFEAVREADLSVATIGWRLAVANAPLCDRREAALGLQLHTPDQFDTKSRPAANKHFAFASPVAIEGVVAGSPAERAGLRQDDSLVSVGSVDMAALPGAPGTTKRLVAAQLAIAAMPPDVPLQVSAIRQGIPVHVTVQPVSICRSRFELRIAADYGASADGTMVQVSSQFLEHYPKDQLAAVIAHEFAHNVLHHRDRLEARGVNWGLLSGFGANVKYFRQTELQADLLSVYLLANAGYSPRASIAFWKQFGPSKAGGIFRSRSHPQWRDRIATMEAEIAKLEADPKRPAVPNWLAERDQPLSGDWQSILVRAR